MGVSEDNLSAEESVCHSAHHHSSDRLPWWDKADMPFCERFFIHHLPTKRKYYRSATPEFLHAHDLEGKNFCMKNMYAYMPSKDLFIFDTLIILVCD